MIIIFEKEQEELENWGRIQTNNGIVKIGQIREKGSGGLRRFIVTQTPVKNYLLTLV